MYKKITFIFLIINQFIFSQSSTHHIYYVDASKTDNLGNGLSWGAAKKDIQNAIDLAVSGDSVWIKAGVYYPNASPNMSASVTVTSTSALTSRDYYILLKDGVSIYGGFEGNETNLNQRSISNYPTYIDGDIGMQGDKADNCYHLMIYLGTYSTLGVTVDGLVFRNANATRLSASSDVFESTIINANGFDNYIQRRLGAGIYVQQGLNSYFTNTVFENNECENRGAGIYMDGGFGLYCSYFVTNCYFVNNRISQSTYGAMSNIYGNIYCYNSVFHNNSVGNFQYGEGVALTLIRSKNKIVNCTFTNNQSFNGSALGIFPSSATSTDTTEIYNCIFYGTTRNPSFAGISGYDFKSAYDTYKPIVKNCSLIHPSANYTEANYNSLDITSSGNFYEQEPFFSDITTIKGADGNYFTADDGLAILANSVLKNSGDNSLLPVSLTNDITGASRILTAKVDIGAYEVDGVLSTVSFEFLGIKMFPNPTNSSLTIQLKEYENATVKIIDVNGRILQSHVLTDIQSTFDVSNLSNGMYFLQVTTENGSASEKFIKSK